MSTPRFPFPTLCKSECDRDKTGCAWNFHVAPQNVVRAAQYFLAEGYFIEDVTGLEMEEGLEVLYHFAHWDKPGRMRVRVLVPFDEPRLPSIAGVYQGAEWHERETRDFFGIEFAGNPNPMPLLLDENESSNPLRKADKKRASASQLFDNYMLADCWPDFVQKEDEEPEAGEKAAEQGEGQ